MAIYYNISEQFSLEQPVETIRCILLHMFLGYIVVNGP